MRHHFQTFFEETGVKRRGTTITLQAAVFQTRSMAFELFLSKKLNKAEENDWLLHNEKSADHGWPNQNGYLVEKTTDR